MTTPATLYTPEEGQPTAKLRYINSYYKVTSLRRLDLQSCASSPRWEVAAQFRTSLIPFSLPEKVESDVQMIGSSPDEEHNIREMVIQTDEPFVFVADQYESPSPTAMTTKCQVFGIFQPAEGGQYEMVYEADVMKCAVRIRRLSEADDGEIIRTPESSFRTLNLGGGYRYVESEETLASVCSSLSR